MKKLFGILGIGAGLAALVGGGLALAKSRGDEEAIELKHEEEYEEYEDETEEE